jgi:hypothetical protein
LIDPEKISSGSERIVSHPEKVVIKTNQRLSYSLKNVSKLRKNEKRFRFQDASPRLKLIWIAFAKAKDLKFNREVS